MKIIDVREIDEWNEGHRSDALHIPLSCFLESVDEAQLSLDEEIGIMCASGARSQKAVGIMKEKGYRNVTNIGGIENI